MIGLKWGECLLGRREWRAEICYPPPDTATFVEQGTGPRITRTSQARCTHNEYYRTEPAIYTQPASTPLLLTGLGEERGAKRSSAGVDDGDTGRAGVSEGKWWVERLSKLSSIATFTSAAQPTLQLCVFSWNEFPNSPRPASLRKPYGIILTNNNLRGRVRDEHRLNSRPAVKPASARDGGLREPSFPAHDPVKLRSRRYSPDERRFSPPRNGLFACPGFGLPVDP